MSFRDYCRPESARTPSRASSSWALTEARDLARRGLIAGYAVETVAAAAYLNNTTLGTQGATLIATAATACPITTATAQTYVITGTTLVPGSYLTLTFSAAMTNAGGASTELMTGVTLQ